MAFLHAAGARFRGIIILKRDTNDLNYDKNTYWIRSSLTIPLENIRLSTLECEVLKSKQVLFKGQKVCESVTPEVIEPAIFLAATSKSLCSRFIVNRIRWPLANLSFCEFSWKLCTANMDFCCISTVILFLIFVVILRTVYVLKRRRDHGPLDRRKPVTVMVVAGSGTPCCIDRMFLGYFRL